MAEGGFQFATPLWLLALAAPLLAWLLWRRLGVNRPAEDRWRAYADPHLLPYLLLATGETRAHGRRFALWSLLWCLLVLALAGPRWGYHEVSSYTPGIQLVVLLDLSASMNVDDVKPSRLSRARQEIEDLLDAEKGLRIGLIAFATVPHVVAPITDDAETVRHLLPSLTTDLVHLPGSRPVAALARARQLLSARAEEGSRAVLLLSDGDFDEPGLDDEVKAMADAGITVHVMGFGTTGGGVVPTAAGPSGLRDRNGEQVLSPLDEAGLKHLADLGGGLYLRADYRDDDTKALLETLSRGGKAHVVQVGAQRIWEERYYVPVVLMLLLLLPWFRRRTLREL